MLHGIWAQKYFENWQPHANMFFVIVTVDEDEDKTDD